MHRIFLAIFGLCWSHLAYSNYAEYFGAAPENSMLGGQMTGDPKDASNNYHAPALMAFDQQIRLSFSAGLMSTHFKPIDTVVTRNSLNSLSGNQVQTGKVDTDYETTYMAAIHASLPVRKVNKVSLSVISPIGHLIDANTGDPFLPEYVMFRARHRRSIIYGNFARQFSKEISLSLGVHIATQAAANMEARAVPNGSTQSGGTFTTVRTKVKPSLALIAGFAYRPNEYRDTATTLTYQQEAKSNFRSNVAGTTSQPVLFPFDLNVSSMLFYDPHIIRLSQSIDFVTFQIIGSVEYQIWGNYETPIIKSKKNYSGGLIEGSIEYETINLRNPIIPRIGILLDITDRFSLGAGVAYRQSPMDSDFSQAGNSVDSSALIGALGMTYTTRLWDQFLVLTVADQIHQLKQINVVKTSGREDGDTTQGKVGSPGYTIGGYIHQFSIGAKMTF